MRKSHDALEGELKDRVQADIDAKVKRKDIIAKHGVSYLQLQKTFGYTCRKPRKNGPVTSPEAPAS